MIRTIDLPFAVRRPILACGADMKGAFAMAKGREAFLAEGFGDLGNLDNFTRYEKAIAYYRRKLNIKPAIIACDLHPDYFSTHFAENSKLQTPSSKLLKVQHHETHIASAIIDNSVKGGVIGVAFDGTGFGWDGNIWGGEFFIGGLSRFKRAAHLEYIPMPGREIAVKEPWRMAASYLYRAFGDKFLKIRIGYMRRFKIKDWVILKDMINKDINSPLTSSMGRLFDAAGSLILARPKVNHEAELPIELERIADTSCRSSYGFDIEPKNGMLILKPWRTMQGIVKDLSKGINTAEISCKFHNTVSDMILETIALLSKNTGIKKVVLSGGVFQNAILRGRVTDMLKKEDLKIYPTLHIPVNDSGIPIGQLAIANSRVLCA